MKSNFGVANPRRLQAVFPRRICARASAQKTENFQKPRRSSKRARLGAARLVRGWGFSVPLCGLSSSRLFLEGAGFVTGKGLVSL